MVFVILFENQPPSRLFVIHRRIDYAVFPIPVYVFGTYSEIAKKLEFIILRYTFDLTISNCRFAEGKRASESGRNNVVNHGINGIMVCI